MTQLRALEQRLNSLDEIGEIMRSMKSLAFMETRKLARLIPNQQAMVEQIDQVATDFLDFHPDLLPAAEGAHQVYLLVGSRRGFCGDFNERLITRWQDEAADERGSSSTIAVGYKLCLRLEAAATPVAALDGADVAEEIPGVLAAIARELALQHQRHPALSLTVLWHREADAEPRMQRLLPPFQEQRQGSPEHGFGAELNLPPAEFLLGLVEQYLYAALHAILYESLQAESQRRVRHLENAVRHLEDRAEDIQLRLRTLRQEEIIEEIEVILLNATDLDRPTERGRQGND